MVNRALIARDELGPLEVEVLFVARVKHDGAVVLIALGGEMGGLRQREHEIGLAGVEPFVRVIEHERRGELVGSPRGQLSSAQRPKRAISVGVSNKSFLSRIPTLTGQGGIRRSAV